MKKAAAGLKLVRYDVTSNTMAGQGLNPVMERSEAEIIITITFVSLSTQD
jgi:hypothetical protein